MVKKFVIKDQTKILLSIFFLVIGYVLYGLIFRSLLWLSIIFLMIAIILTIYCITRLILATLYFSVHPTDIAVKMRMKKFTGSVLSGGWGFWLPVLDDFIIFDSRIKTIWIGFIGARGHQKIQIKEFEQFKEKFLIIDRKKYYSKNDQEFNSSDFYSFGPLFTSNREEMNILSSVNFKITDALKLARTLNIISNSEEEKSKYRTPLVAKLASALKETVARMTLDEIFEERQKLMELLVRTLSDLKDDWGLEVLSVNIEEMWLEDEKLQEMLDEKKKAEIIADAKQIMERHDAEIKFVLAKAEQERETIIAKAREESNLVQEQSRQDVAKLRRDLMEIRAKADKTFIEAQSKARTIIAEAEAKRLIKLNRVIEEKTIQHELINTIPVIMDQISLANEKFTIIPSKKIPFYPFLQGRQEEEEEI